MADPLFICGCPRSGTTLFANVLNAHPAIVVGIERFGTRFFKEPLTPDLFTKERFFDIRSGDTFYDTLDFAPVYAQKRDRFGEARLVGDKIPLLFDYLPRLHAQFPTAKVVFCLRNILDVAASYEVRALNPDDRTWRRDKGAAAAVEDWTRALAAFHAHRETMDIAVFDYDRFADDGEQQLRRLAAWLGVDWARPLQRRIEATRARAVKLAEERKQPLSGAAKKQILLDAPIPAYRRAIRLAEQRPGRREPARE